MLTEGRTSPRHYRPDSLAGQVAEHPDGIKAAELAAAFPAGDVHSCLAALLAAGRVTRLRRGVYALAEPSIDADADADRTRPGGLQPQTVRSALTTFSAVVQSHVNQGVLPRNVIALVERPKDADPDDATTPAEAAGTETTAKSWTLAEVQRFRDAVRDHRLCACWLLSCYGLGRSEVLGLRWSAIDLDAGVLSVRRGRVAVGTKRLRVHRSRSGRGASCRYRPS
jgi:integrase